ncbi:MAG: FISUMP domain-containing protein [Methylococcales bacterium]
MKIYTTLFILVLFLSCNKSSVETIKVVIPIAPTSLNGNVLSNTKISLSWTDHSTNEDGFKIERKTTSSSYVQIATILKDITSFTDSTLSPNTQYNYRVYSYNSAGSSATYSNELGLKTKSVPQIITNTISSISYRSALGGGTISSDGGSPIIARGIIWDTLPSPTLNIKTKTSDSVGVGNFTSTISKLIFNTKYYVRSYAINSTDTSYGNEISFITLTPTLDSTQVLIGKNIWSKKNLDVLTYRNGDVIPQVTDLATWAKLTTGAWCYYNNDTSQGAIYGKLYNWYAVNDPRGLAPQGWHIPTDAEWTTLGTLLGGDGVAGGQMKTTSASGFAGLLGGGRYIEFDFDGRGSYGNWWSATPKSNSTDVWLRSVYYNSNNLYTGWYGKSYGFSVRCVMD